MAVRGMIYISDEGVPGAAAKLEEVLGLVKSEPFFSLETFLENC
jgi:hypothetical protein